MDTLDKLDLEILRILYNNPKQSYRDIAKQLEVSDRTVARRVKRMERDGIILGYRPVLSDYAKDLVSDTQEPVEFRFSLAEWNEFEKALQSMYYTAADVILFYAGRGIGQAMYRAICTDKPKVEEALSRLSKVCNLRGWGNVLFEKSEDNAIKTVINGLRINRFMFRGILTSMLEALTRRSIEVLPLEEEGGTLLVKILDGSRR